jgi:DNA-binding XRE family transcriptional regulator
MPSQYAGSTLSEPLLINDSSNVGHMPRLTRLRALRLRAALTQADLAERAGVARTTIVRLEQGDPNVLPTTLRKLAKALRVKPTDLWEEEER